LADFQSDDRYFGRFSMKFRWNSVWQSLFLFYCLVELYISSKFSFLLIQMQEIKVIFLFNASILSMHSILYTI
jgi:hypothetical protein